MSATSNDKHPSQHECMADDCRTDESKIGEGHQALFEDGFVKVGRCRECRRRVAPCDVSYRTEESKDPRNFIEDGVRLGSCPHCSGPVFVEMDVICEQCGETWFWWDIYYLTASDVTSEAEGVICQCPSCDGDCLMIGAEGTAEAEQNGPPRGLTGRFARQDVAFRNSHRQALAHLMEAYTQAIEVTENLACACEALGEMSAMVADEMDAIADEDGNIHPQWPSDAFAYYNEQLGRASAIQDTIKSMAERISSIHRGLRMHDRRHQVKTPCE
jgi:hypothetical protein